MFIVGVTNKFSQAPQRRQGRGLAGVFSGPEQGGFVSFHAAPTELGWFLGGIFYKHGAPNGAPAKNAYFTEKS
jgi:hypothetical protein